MAGLSLQQITLDKCMEDILSTDRSPPPQVVVGV